MQLELLERREVFSGSPLAPEYHVVFAPDTSAEVMAAYDDLEQQDGYGLFSFADTDRWTRTSSSSSTLGQGDATVIRWSIAPDGTPIDGFDGEPDAPSNLRSFLAGIYGSNSASNLAQNQPWFSVIQQTFDRWSEVSGVTYVYEPADDGAAISSTAGGVVGVRGDVRISGHYIDGPSDILAYNFFPTFGDMVIDTGDTFYANTNSNSLRLRNTLAHELGHGLGLDHVSPTNGTKLMEPMISLNFDGPQFDDILAVNRGYGDRLEKNGGNNSAVTASSLGSSGTFTIDTLSIDDDSDVDWFQVTVGAGATLNVTATPLGTSYTSNGVTFNSLAQSNLALAVYGNGGTTLIASASANAAGLAESISNLALAGSGTYYVRVTGSANAAQMYRLSGSVAVIAPAAPEAAVFDGSTEVADGTATVSLGTVTVGSVAQKTFTVRNIGTANLTLGSTVALPAGFSLSAPLGTTTVAPGGQTSFTVSANTAVVGTYSGTLSFATNDSDENPYNFNVTAVVAAAPVTAPEISVREGATNIVDNSGSATFGTVTVGAAATKTFTVTNSGTANLSLGAITLPTGFSLTQGLGATVLLPGASTTFQVTLNTSVAATRTGTLSLANNDADEGPFNFALSGTVVAPQPTVTFSDNFDRSSSSSLGANWTERAGNISVSSQMLANATTGTSLATVNNITLGNVVLTANVSIGTGSAARDSGLVARQSGTGTGNQYWAGIRYSNGRYAAEIWEANNGNWTRLSTTAISVNSAAIRFEAIGSALKLYVNNVLTNSVTDATLTSGRAGVSLTGAAARLDNFSLLQPAAPATVRTATATPTVSPAVSSQAHSAQWLAALDQLWAAWEQARERREA